MMIYLVSFLWVFYFCLLFLIMEMVSPLSVLVGYPSDLSFDGVLDLLELLLYRVNSDYCATESWLSIDQKIPLTIEVFSKRALQVLNFSVPGYIPVIGLQAYVFPFEYHQISLVDLFLFKGFVSYNTGFIMFDFFFNLFSEGSEIFPFQKKKNCNIT